jgi:restriction system protein
MDEAQTKGEKAIDPIPFFNWAKDECGMEGAAMALAMFTGLNEDLHKSSMSQFRRFEWSDVTELEELFKSEKLETLHGEFFDQRFVDFLSQNFQSISQINWRKFEGLTCEFFHRIGFEVEIGKGRNDESVDARVWARGKRAGNPPLILVQCKRQKDSVEKVVVKALYADVIHEKAKLGLVVTSSALAPGARKVCSARSYPICEANRDTLKKWIGAMRTPYAGIFLGE